MPLVPVINIPTTRARRKPVLIRCEGSKTEPNYLGALVRDLGLTAVSVPRDHITDPLVLVRDAINSLRRDLQLFRAYVIFDRDQHAHFADAVGLAQGHPFFPDRLRVVRSYPSFEVWLLHHFEACRAPLHRDEAYARLKSVYPAYEKGSVNCMDEFMSRLPQALANADQAFADAEATGSTNPSTEMHILVRELQDLALDR